MLNDPHLIAPPGKKISLSEYDTRYTNHIADKEQARVIRDESIERLKAVQRKLYAHNRYAVLIIFQAMDAAGNIYTGDTSVGRVTKMVPPKR